MQDADLAPVARLLDPLLRTLEALEFIARHLHPAGLEAVLTTVGTPDAALREARAPSWSEALSGIGAALDDAADHALTAFDALRRAAGGDEMRGAFLGLRQGPKALEALYPLAGLLPPVNRFFLDPRARGDEALAASFMAPPAHDATGVMQIGEGDTACWMYAPENIAPDTALPLVVALHGGGGDGRRFLWSWLRDARTFGAVLAAPSSIGDTWALMGPDLDSPRLADLVDFARTRWRIDPARILLTGMSDGGTFSYVSGLDEASPFTHLAPVAAAFHPMLVQMTAPARVRGLPVHIAHGIHDWMFPVTMAHDARDALAAVGAAVTYREMADLSHTYPRDLNPDLLAWLNATAR